MRHTLCRIDYARWRARVLAPSRHLQFVANVRPDFRRIVVNEVPHAMVRDVPEFRPVPQGGDRWFFVFRENPADPEADNVCELSFHG